MNDYVTQKDNEQLAELVAEFDAALTALVEAEQDFKATPREQGRSDALVAARNAYERATEKLAIRTANLWRADYRLTLL